MAELLLACVWEVFMEAYSGFARVYDLFMDNVPYREWCDFIDTILKEYGIQENILLDLGCGTGTMTRIMSEMGYDMIGVDQSPEMLDIARELEYEAMDMAWDETEESAEALSDTAAMEADEAEPAAIDESILEGLEEEYYDCAYEGQKSPTIYLWQDMRELELYGTIGACYCSCNSINYILNEEDLKKVFSLVNNYLFPGGLFIFDINTPYKYEKLMGDNTIAENRPQGSFIWENSYDPETGINIYDLTLYISERALEGEQAEEEEDLPYYRFQETHIQKSYSLELIQSLLEEAGMEFVAAYDNYSRDPVRRDSEIITILAREKGKKA